MHSINKPSRSARYFSPSKQRNEFPQQFLLKQNAFCNCLSYREQSNENEELHQQLKDLKNYNVSLKQRVSVLEAERRNLNVKVASNESEIEDLKTKCEQLTKENTKLQNYSLKIQESNRSNLSNQLEQEQQREFSTRVDILKALKKYVNSINSITKESIKVLSQYLREMELPDSDKINKNNDIANGKVLENTEKKTDDSEGTTPPKKKLHIKFNLLPKNNT